MFTVFAGAGTIESIVRVILPGYLGLRCSSCQAIQGSNRVRVAHTNKESFVYSETSEM